MLRFCVLAFSLALRIPASAQSRGSAAVQDDSITLRTIIPNILGDQKRIYWEFPRELSHGDHWIPVATFLGASGLLIALDQYQSPYFRRVDTYSNFNSGLSGINTSLIIAAVPSAFYLIGSIKGDQGAKKTALMTGEAVADSEIAAEILKLATRRARPESISLQGNFADTWLDSGSPTAGGFPSGHTIAAFSAATVLSKRYGRDRHWVPFVAYGVAGAIGFSRVTLSAHNLSDVFVGAALGYVIGRFVESHRHSHPSCANSLCLADSRR